MRIEPRVHDSAPHIDIRRYDAVIFDMDGVVTDSASIHAAAWTETFDAFLTAEPAGPGQDRSPFSEADYLKYVDGKPRYSGVEDFLTARHIQLPRGGPADPDSVATICGLGNRKDNLFRAILARDGVAAFESTVALVRRLRFQGIRTGVVSASRHCAQVLAAAGIGHLFEVRVDGMDAAELRLPGKPDPAMLCEVVSRLDVAPARAVVVEDAEAGVAAGRAGGFALVLGIERAGPGGRLVAAGADAAVDDAVRIGVHGGFRRIGEVPDAFEFWPRITDLLGIETPAVLMDFDGTLAEIVTDPAAAEMVEGAATALTELAARCPVAVISGRGLDDLRERMPVPGVWLAGSHGFELMAPDGTRHVHDAVPGAETALTDAAESLRSRLRDIPGVMVEHKRFAVAVHFRTAGAEVAEQVMTTVRDTGRAAGLRVSTGRKVVELRPDVDWDKGEAVRWILRQLDIAALPIYLGDDVTDEDAFDAIEPDGLALVVHDAENTDRFTAARYSLAGPRRVGNFLQRLVELVRAAPAGTETETWSLVYEGYDPGQEKLREALCTLGNGYFATRGAAPECRAGESHYPGTYVAGLYNRLRDRVAGQEIDNESLVNVPNWLPVTFRISDGDWFEPDTAELLDYRQRLDIRRAELTRRFRFRDDTGRITGVEQRRFVAVHRPHLAALVTTITAENWTGTLYLRSTVDGSVTNSLVERYRDLSGTHLGAVRTTRLSEDSALLATQTNSSLVPITVAIRNILRSGAAEAPETVCGERSIGHEFTVEAREGEPVVLEKTAVVCTGRDHASAGPDDEAARELETAQDYESLFAGHAAAWDRIWGRLRIDLDDHGSVRTLRLHLLHLIQTLSPSTADLDAGVPARGLHGEAYRGHVFWDELFVLPVLTPRFPGLTRSLLRYRYRRLPEARRAAAAAGLAGAMFPWQSGSDGREESQQLHLNPLSGRWNPDPSRRAHHVGAAVAYTVWQYYQTTGDLEYLTERGAELLVETARFWAALADFDTRLDRCVLTGVIGPDEFHAGYPDAPGTGVDNNAYTNVMAAWTIHCALEALEVIAPRARAELLERLGVASGEPSHWREVAHRMYVPFHDGVISQFEGYDRLQELDWDHYRRRYGDIQRLDRILEAEGDDIGRYRAGKQADVLMLFYLFSADELRELFARLGYELPGEMIPRTIDYYLTRTSHGSTSSALVHSWVLARANRERALEFFARVVESDVGDIQGGTTGEGIHLAAMAGSVDLLQRCFTGLEVRGGRLIFCPYWPETLGTLSFPMLYRGHRLMVRIGGRRVEIGSEPGDAPPIDIVCRDQAVRLSPGNTVCLEDSPAPAADT
ncbi:trehalose-phosphatase [Nocardia sp. NPDC019395]|uniref:trehalose-phosphatase n=1 Tax=Nocardia sp. NPDC019395 TaxID=3154686 RepID=UPI0033E58629